MSQVLYLLSSRYPISFILAWSVSVISPLQISLRFIFLLWSLIDDAPGYSVRRDGSSAEIVKAQEQALDNVELDWAKKSFQARIRML